LAAELGLARPEDEDLLDYPDPELLELAFRRGEVGDQEEIRVLKEKMRQVEGLLGLQDTPQVGIEGGAEASPPLDLNKMVGQMEALRVEVRAPPYTMVYI